MRYSIYHPVDGHLNHMCEPMAYMYELVFTVDADTIDQAFYLCQNDFNEEYRKLNIRSTSVGDIIKAEDDDLECSIIKPIGLNKVPSSWLRYIDYSYSSAEPANYEYGE